MSACVYCLVDCDPYGFDILATYRFGSMSFSIMTWILLNLLLSPKIQWIGAFPSDSENYDLPQQCLLPLTTEDKRKTEDMLLRCYLHQKAPDWRSELELILQRGTKFEIEALSVHSLSFLSEFYIPSKIQERTYMSHLIVICQGQMTLTFDSQNDVLKDYLKQSYDLN
ncbi:hypothetical protein CRYUN_Cryun38cG0076200 [Craigia yunnanensis]